jgi:hypothetical protein
MIEATMTKQWHISLIAGVALWAVGILSIAGALNGRIAFDDQPDALVTQLYTSHPGATDQQQAMLSGQTASTGQSVSR